MVKPEKPSLQNGHSQALHQWQEGVPKVSLPQPTNQEEAKTVTLLPPALKSAQDHKGLAPAPQLAAAQGRSMLARQGAYGETFKSGSC